MADVQAGLWIDNETLGAAVGFCFADYKAIGILTGRHPRTIAVMDATRDQLAAYRQEFHRPHKLAAQRRRRAAKAAAKATWKAQWGDLSDRDEAVFMAMPAGRETTVAGIKVVVRAHPAFAKLTGRSLDRAVQRSVHKLEKDGRIRAQNTYTGTGLPTRRFRKPPLSPATRHLGPKK